MDAGEQERRRKEAEALFVHRRVSITSKDFTEPVVLDVLSVEPNRGCPSTELYSLHGTDAQGGYPRAVGFWERDTCINILE